MQAAASGVRSVQEGIPKPGWVRIWLQIFCMRSSGFHHAFTPIPAFRSRVFCTHSSWRVRSHPRPALLCMAAEDPSIAGPRDANQYQRPRVFVRIPSVFITSLPVPRFRDFAAAGYRVFCMHSLPVVFGIPSCTGESEQQWTGGKALQHSVLGSVSAASRPPTPPPPPPWRALPPVHCCSDSQGSPPPPLPPRSREDPWENVEFPLVSQCFFTTPLGPGSWSPP